MKLKVTKQICVQRNNAMLQNEFILDKKIFVESVDSGMAGDGTARHTEPRFFYWYYFHKFMRVRQAQGKRQIPQMKNDV